MTVPAFLAELKAAGLGTLPGTAAEILDDEVRAIICPDKLNTAAWLDVVRAAHALGLRTTSTIMYGHVEQPLSWARHLLALRDLQTETGGFTEFVPLPFVHMEAPMYLRGAARRGPTFREAVLMHAVARLVLHPHIANIQTSWVKMGPAGAAACLKAGANDLGGTLMNESISRAAGTEHGQEFPPPMMEALIRSLGRVPVQRDTLYRPVAARTARSSLRRGAARPGRANPAAKRRAAAYKEFRVGEESGVRVGRDCAMLQEPGEVCRMVDVHGDAGQADDRGRDAGAAGRVEMREEAVVAEAQRHRVRRGAEDGVGAEIVVRRHDGERGRRLVRGECCRHLGDGDRGNDRRGG